MVTAYESPVPAPMSPLSRRLSIDRIPRRLPAFQTLPSFYTANAISPSSPAPEAAAAPSQAHRRGASSWSHVSTRPESPKSRGFTVSPNLGKRKWHEAGSYPASPLRQVAPRLERSVPLHPRAPPFKLPSRQCSSQRDGSHASDSRAHSPGFHAQAKADGLTVGILQRSIRVSDTVALTRQGAKTDEAML